MVIVIYDVIDIVYINSWRKFDKTLTHFDAALCKKKILFIIFIYLFIFIACGVQLDNGVHPLGLFALHLIVFFGLVHTKIMK